MTPIVDVDNDFEMLNNEYKKLSARFFSSIDELPCSKTLEFDSENPSQALTSDYIYCMDDGHLGLMHQNKRLFYYEKNEFVWADAGLQLKLEQPLNFIAEGRTCLRCYSTEDFIRLIQKDTEISKLWLEVALTFQALISRMLASASQIEVDAEPSYQSFEPGDILIQQGDPADVVHTILDGEAEVLVNGVRVGIVREGEIVGIIAVLTDSARTASVKAITPCSVLTVSKEKFATLIRTNPHLILTILTDMAKYIVNLNEKVVGLTIT